MYSFSRIFAVLKKELVQMRRDRLTFAIMIMIPIVQLTLFGYAINTDPRHLPTLLDIRDDGPFTRAIVSTLHTSTFFDVTRVVGSAAEGDEALKTGAADFVVIIPEGFERALVRGERPQIVVEADATDPVAAGGPVGALPVLLDRALSPLMEEAALAAPDPPPWDLVVHRRYNPAGVTAYNIVPGLLAVILTMTMAMITAIAITRELERGTMETLLATPARPMEVMIGKILPYVGVGYIQIAILLIAGVGLFGVPFTGGLAPLLLGATVFIVVNLALGFLISTLARTQMQAMQMTFFFFLPSILLSGFIFPFEGMPLWARWLGEALPTTHFIRLTRAVVLKDAGFTDIVNQIWPMLIQLTVITTIAVNRYRQTLD
ncbi:MAG: ABC transporter permease [Euryhalocaulis sp.]|uniref:ABC transporter permease n=1 Tax=Euryhalocaulis sp. TaxID=2744307 RepID=UPI0017C4A0B9|nr:ABC transporter permease [Euryhalocaulis sp.]MBA4801105.1 ABC transporter permease [Euryhalocaulis sp.]